ncbi:uncharacterized protein LOC119936515 [Tachyglossus aculeatus]|uniref:uncharacterized protein LOC119936515 n=1 Tax=Tachyglossus aculeatus TaxID=9261 RepID=UPI0018F4FB65|nr:uncharacterized protein LOC119936515 [Tachyglossus aculeatus]
MSLLDDYRFTSSAILKELGQMLHFFADRHITFPQGIANLVNYSWKELTEGAVCRSTQHKTLADKRGRSLKSGGSVTGDKVSLGTEHLRPEVTGNARGQAKKYLFIEGEKDKSNHDNAPPKLLANKGPVPQSQSTNLPVKISFSMSSKYREERGWIFQHTNSNAEAMELKALLVCAVERLQQAQIQMNREKAKLRKMGFSKPVILRHYDDSKREIFVKKFQRHQCFWLELLKNKTQIPVIKLPDPTLNKLHYALVDGSSST